jgi:hypothetical protein
MSFHTIPNTGPFNDPVLDEGRVHALIAVDDLKLALPAELVGYLIILEQRHLDLTRQSKAEFLRQSWRERQADDGGDDDGGDDDGRDG